MREMVSAVFIIGMNEVSNTFVSFYFKNSCGVQTLLQHLNWVAFKDFYKVIAAEVARMK